MKYDSQCCIVGGGPAGMILALLLGRAGITTTIFEEHGDFERDFRGDTVHPSTMELMGALGLADRLLALPHAKIQRLVLDTPGGPIEMADLTRLPTAFPFITMMPQSRFLDVLAGELRTMPSVQLIMGAPVHGLLWDDPWGLSGVADRPPLSPASSKNGSRGDRSGPPSRPANSEQAQAGAEHPSAPQHASGQARTADAAIDRTLPVDAIVRGVRYRTSAGQHDLRAPLTIGADGRFSRLRRLAGFELQSSAPPMDVIWFRLPRRPDDPEDARGKMGNGHLMVILNRGDEWQIAYVIAKGSYRQIRDDGLPAFRQAIVDLAPEFADRVGHLQDWRQTSLLSVEAGRVRQWFRPGLLLIGDAAHVMSPVGGVGINYAIQDAVVAANVLTGPLRRGRLRLRDLAAVQRRREIPTRIIQGFQRLVQEQVLTRVLASDTPMQPPSIMRAPILRDVIPRMLALGVWPVHPNE